MSSGYFGQSSAPPPRSLSGEIGQISNLVPQITDTEKQLADYQVNTLYPQMSQQERTATTLQRRSDLADIGRYGQGYARTLQGLSPNWSNALSGINAQIAGGNQPDALALRTNADALAAGPSAIRSTLDAQAVSDLGMGRSLSPEQIRDAQQSSRAAWTDRGLSGSNADVVSEAMNRENYANALQAQRRQFASGVMGLDLSEDAQNRNFQTGVESQNEARLANWRNFLGAGAQIGQNSLAPMLGFFGQRAAVNPTAPAGILGAATQASSAAWDPMLNYGSDVFNTNFNADAATRINNANNMAAIHGAVIGAVGNLAGGAMKACWVAREIYGPENDDWRVFKHWLLFHAPHWFYLLYLKFGERFARFIRNKPRVKRLIKPFFDRKVREIKALHPSFRDAEET